MRVLLLTQYFWPESFLINDLVELLSARGVEVTVLTGKPNYPGGRIFNGYKASGVTTDNYGGATVLRLPIIPRGQRSRLGLALNYVSFILAASLLGPALMRGRSYDLVFVYAPSPLLQALPAILLARRRKVPLVLWVQDLWPESLSATGHVRNRWLLATVARVVRMIYRATDRILVQSRAFIAPVAKLTYRPEKIHYYPNLYRLPAASQISERANQLIQTLSRHFCVVFAGNLGTAQALDTIVEAAVLLKSRTAIRIVLVGSGSQDHWLAQQRNAHQLDNLVLAGRFEPSDMPAILGVANALLVTLKPDPVFGLTIPSKVQAYLAAGRPLVAALDGEGARIIDESGAGFCTPAGDATRLAESIVQLIELSTAERQAMGERGRAYFDQHFSPERQAGDLIEHFRQLTLATEKNA